LSHDLQLAVGIGPRCWTGVVAARLSTYWDILSAIASTAAETSYADLHCQAFGKSLHVRPNVVRRSMEPSVASAGKYSGPDREIVATLFARSCWKEKRAVWADF